MKKTTIKYWLLLSLFAIVNNLYSQCEIKNNAFKNGENISYDLYYHYGIIKAKAGSGFLKTSTVNYRGENVYNISMQLNTSGLARVYRVNDTLTAYVDTNLRPMLFIKNVSLSCRQPSCPNNLNFLSTVVPKDNRTYIHW